MSIAGNKKTSNVGTAALSSTQSKRSLASLNVSVTKSKGPPPKGSTIIGTRVGASSGSRRSFQQPLSDKSAFGNARMPVQIFDEAGNDVTPLPLVTFDSNLMKKPQGNIIIDSPGGTPTDLMSQTSASVYQGTVTASAFGGGPFSSLSVAMSYKPRSAFSAETPSYSRSVFSQSCDTGTESVEDMEQIGDHSLAWADIQHKREEVKEVLMEADLERVVEIILSESDTIWLMDMAGVCVNVDSEEAVNVKENNKKYAELIKARVGNDLYMERGMNTFNEPTKYKLVQTNKLTFAEAGVSASTWDMYDTYEAQNKSKNVGDEGEEEEEGTISRPVTPKGDGDKSRVAESFPGADMNMTGSTAASAVANSRLSDQSSSLDSHATVISQTDSVSTAAKDGSVAATQPEVTPVNEERVLKAPQLITDLFVMERAINLNTYQPKQALYRDLPIIRDRDKPEAISYSVVDVGPSMDRLWAYTCSVTKGHNVSCITWNKSNPDLVAVGYGQFEFTNQKSGIICCWSLKNPEYPERLYNCRHGVLALDFANNNPNLLAVGLYDGGVAIYNVRNPQDEAVLDNFEVQGKHTSAVWQVKWIEKERGSGDERAEVIVTISTDGRVTQWSIRKGFESHDLMRLKRMPTRISVRGREKKGEAFISRYAGGLCFDFAEDSNIYLAGTEEGHIHKCSCSYNEQYLESYGAHTGPVYRIQWSPFVPDVFLSCSADWTVRLWDHERTTPVLSFYSSTKAVNDLCWSPRSATVFACVNEGAIEVWDLTTSTLDPVLNYNGPQSAKQTAVSFARNSECLLVGDSEGAVTVYLLRGMQPPPMNQAGTLNGIIKASLASQLQSISTTSVSKQVGNTEAETAE